MRKSEVYSYQCLEEKGWDSVRKEKLEMEESIGCEAETKSEAGARECEGTGDYSECEVKERLENCPREQTTRTGQKAESQSGAEEECGEKRIRWFRINHKYMSICRYALFVIFSAILLYIMVSHGGQTIAFLKNMIHVLTPFLVGVLIAYFLNPLVARIDGLLQKRIAKGKLPRVTVMISIFMAYVIVLGFIILAFVFVVPQVGASIRELTEKVPGMYERIARELGHLEERFPELERQFPAINWDDFNKQLASAVPNLVSYGTNVVSSLVPMVYSFSVSIVKLVINLVLGLFISIYMIYSKDSFRYEAKRVVYALFPEEKGNVVCTTFRECNDIFGAFLISKAIDSLIIGCLCCILMTILGLPYAVLLSVIVGITNMIPYFGPFVGAVPGVLIYLCIDWELALIFAIMILALQQFDGLILGPRLLGQSTGLSPIWVIFAITVGGAYFGFVGMFIGVPVVAVIAHLCNKFITNRLRGKKIKALQQLQSDGRPAGEKPTDGDA